MLRPDREHHPYDLYEAVRKLANKGLGWEDVMVKMRLPKTPEVTGWVRRIVMSTHAEYRGWK